MGMKHEFWTWEQYPSAITTVYRWGWVRNVVYTNGSVWREVYP